MIDNITKKGYNVYIVQEIEREGVGRNPNLLSKEYNLTQPPPTCILGVGDDLGGITDSFGDGLRRGGHGIVEEVPPVEN